jgi:hypothetical protein
MAAGGGLIGDSMPDPLQPSDRIPTIVTVSATSSGSGTGGLVTSEGHPIMLKVIQPMTIIVVRASRVFLQTLLGLLSAGMAVPSLLHAPDFLSLLGTCASLSVASAGVCVIQNMIELLTRFDQKSPTLAA